MSSHDPEITEALSVADLVRRVAGSAGVHVYEFEFLDEQAYRCNVWIGTALDTLLGGVPEGMDEELAWETCIHPEDRPHYDDTALLLHDGVSTEIEYRLVGFDGVTRWVWERCTPRRIDGRLLVDGIVTDITERRKAQEELARARDKLRELAYHDPLTDLANRLLFDEHLTKELARSARECTSFAVLFVDLDDFKAVNDRHGHAAGDDLLREAASRLRSITRDADVVSRLGGDEFLILTGRMQGMGEARTSAIALADRIRATMSVPAAVGGARVVPGASVGVAVYPADGMSADDLLRHADQEMYREKRLRRAA
ncbi:MAG TPA: sensor domain-containing diguanylate cyclase [Gaiellales bacterium]|nr:sensor domain-containing diguanylate cyclase [Gaiellales bacterium]